MIQTSRQLKDFVRNRSKSDSNKAQSLIRLYYMERFLERLSVSKYKHNFILKGGVLVSSMVGSDRRTTMDIDTTIKGQPLSIEDVNRIINEIIEVPMDDGVIFEIIDVYEIMEGAEYTGVRTNLMAHQENMKTPVKIDISTGDAITPGETRYSYRLMFEDREIGLMTYNLETILAEKIETVISRGTANTRLRDFYDIYLLTDLYSDSIDWKLLAKALKATSDKRGSGAVLMGGETIIDELLTDIDMREQWVHYMNKNNYITGIAWEDSVERLNNVWQRLSH